MTLDPIFQAPLPVQIHVFSVIPAMLLGPVAIYRKRRDLVHKTVGYLWVASMATTALSSFFIYGWRVIGPFGPIHVISALVLHSLYMAVRDARGGRTEQHKARMLGTYWWGIGIAGLLTLTPGRRLNRVFFGDNPEVGYWVIGTGLLILAARWWFAKPGRVSSA